MVGWWQCDQAGWLKDRQQDASRTSTHTARTQYRWLAAREAYFSDSKVHKHVCYSQNLLRC